MSINKFRSALYKFNRLAGDLQAATHKKPVEASVKRVGRRVVGSWMSRLLNKLFPPTR